MMLSKRNRSRPNFFGWDRLADQLLGEKVHEQPVVPRAVQSSFVVPHHPYWSESDLRVAGNSGCVVGRGIDDQPVVAVVVYEVAGQGANCVGAKSSAMERWIEIDVDAGVPVVGLILGVPLDRAGDLVLVLDDEGLGPSFLEVLFDGRRQVLPASPPAKNLRRRSDPHELGDIRLGRGSQRYALALQRWRLPPISHAQIVKRLVWSGQP